MKEFFGRFRMDLIVILALFLTAASLFAIRFLYNASTGKIGGSKVEITSDGVLFGIYPLDGDESIEVTSSYGHNTVRIENGACFVESADCRDLICVHSGKIRNRGESIICLPNRLSVRIIGEGEDGYDAVAY